MFEENPVLNVKRFDTLSEEWLEFIKENRSKGGLQHKYDVVIGPVADDNMALLFRQYENEIIDFETLLKGMVYKKTSSQYSFHTEKSIKLLRKVGI